MTTPDPPDVLTPVHATPADAETKLEDGIALCLSGGGYRAMVFHVGVLWRLNETKVLRKINGFRRCRAVPSRPEFWRADGESSTSSTMWQTTSSTSWWSPSA